MKTQKQNVKRSLLAVSCTVLFALTFTSCTFLYLPPLRESLEIPEVLNIDESPGLIMQQDALTLALRLNNVPQEGWLMVQWYSDTNEEVASDSQWIESEDQGFVLNYILPGSVVFTEGNWRAVVSYQDQFIRQFTYAFTAQN